MRQVSGVCYLLIQLFNVNYGTEYNVLCTQHSSERGINFLNNSWHSNWGIFTESHLHTRNPFDSPCPSRSRLIGFYCTDIIIYPRWHYIALHSAPPTPLIWAVRFDYTTRPRTRSVCLKNGSSAARFSKNTFLIARHRHGFIIALWCLTLVSKCVCRAVRTFGTKRRSIALCVCVPVDAAAVLFRCVRMCPTSAISHNTFVLRKFEPDTHTNRDRERWQWQKQREQTKGNNNVSTKRVHTNAILNGRHTGKFIVGSPICVGFSLLFRLFCFVFFAWYAQFTREKTVRAHTHINCLEVDQKQICEPLPHCLQHTFTCLPCVRYLKCSTNDM